jgi:WD40 repeat protein
MDQDGRNAKLVADKVPSGFWTWPSPDGKHLAYQEGQELKLWSFGTNAPLATLAQFPKGKPVEGPAWSRDGRQIAWKDGRQLKVLSLSENTTRVLMEAGNNSEIGEVAWHGGIAWSPDGQYVAFVMQEVPKDSTARSGLWLVKASGGTARKAAEAPASHPRLGAISWNPGGTMVLASGGPEKTRPRTFEHWTLKNFLPKSGR